MFGIVLFLYSQEGDMGIQNLYCGIGILLLFIILGILAITSGNRKNKKEENNYSNELIKWQNDMPRWQNAMQRWEKLYYCSRNDVVFIPGKPITAPIDKMIEFIYSKDREKPEPAGKLCPRCGSLSRFKDQYCIKCGEKIN